MNKDYRDKHLIDATDKQEPDYTTHFGGINDRTISIPDYEKFTDSELLKQASNQFDKVIDLDTIPF